MRRWLKVVSLIVALGLLIAGGLSLMEATRVEGWASASSAIRGLLCWIPAGALLGRRALGFVAYPFTTFFGSLFHPQSQFTETPKSQLLTLRARIAEGRFRSSEHQIKGLLKAYPRDPGLYHVWAMLEAAKGRQIGAVTAEASRQLSAGQFAEYEELLSAVPAQPSGPPLMQQKLRRRE